MSLMAAPRLKVSKRQPVELEAMASSSVLPHRKVIQARGVLLAAQGIATTRSPARLRTEPDTARRWRAKFEALDLRLNGAGCRPKAWTRWCGRCGERPKTCRVD